MGFTLVTLYSLALCSLLCIVYSCLLVVIYWFICWWVGYLVVFMITLLFGVTLFAYCSTFFVGLIWFVIVWYLGISYFDFVTIKLYDFSVLVFMFVSLRLSLVFSWLELGDCWFVCGSLFGLCCFCGWLLVVDFNCLLVSLFDYLWVDFGLILNICVLWVVLFVLFWCLHLDFDLWLTWLNWFRPTCDFVV